MRGVFYDVQVLSSEPIPFTQGEQRDKVYKKQGGERGSVDLDFFLSYDNLAKHCLDRETCTSK